ncbi:MAG TPA: AMP-binding protein, partial [Candidatus Deferrimicrobium sp.]|nr:AMP-binding protein [Candidatus Deferrimicrobium sp.]
NIPFAETDDFPLLDVVVTLDNIHDTSYLRHIHHNISFAFCRKSDHIDIRLDFNTRCYKRETAGQIMEQLKNVARQCAARIDIPLGEIDLLSEEERRRLCEDFNETALEYPQDKTFVESFETQVAKMPDSIAVMGESLLGDIQLSYGETNAKSNQLAWILREKGVKPGVIVGIVMERSVEMVVAITAVLKAGGAYFPIDTRLPEKRIITMLEDSGAIILLTYSDVVKNFSYTTLQGLQRMHISIQATLTSPRPQILNLNDQPFADRSLIDYEKYNQDIGQAMVKNAITIQATRGCPYNCAYCHKIWSKRHVYRSAENIFEEVKLYYDMGVRRFGFIDDIFNLNARNSSRFFQLVIKNRLDVQLYFPNGIRTDILTADYIDLMIEAGVVNLAMALETASPRLQNLIGKNLDLDKFRRNIEYICHQYPGVISELFTMHGFPTETEEEALGTLNFVKSLKWIHFPYINILKIYPGTDMEKLALDNGISREAIIRSEKSHHIEFSDNLPFEKSFTSAYQASLLNDYFLLKERLLKLLPLQMKVLSPEEIILKYNSYLPETIKSIDDIFVHTGLSKNEHIIPCEDNKYTIYSAPVAGFNEKLKSHFPVKKPFSGALKVLLLDVSQPFSDLKRTMQYSVTEAPLGLMYLLTSLFQEFGNRIHGKIAKSGVDFDNYTDLKLLLQEFKPDVIGLRTLIFYKNFFHAVIGMIRHWGYEGPIIAGGPYTTGSHRTMLQDRNIDLAVLGEGENSFNELIRKIIANGGKLPAPEVLREIPGLAFIPARKGTAREILVLDHCKEIFSRYSSANLPHIHRVEDPAYVIATSGSTGKPKGTLIGHRNLVNLAVGLNERIYRRYPGGLNVGLVAPFFFDASIKQVFVALLLGHRLCIVPDCARGDGDELLKFYNSRQIDISDGTPTLIQLLLESAPKNRGNQLAVKHFLIGGEVLLKQPVVDFINRFGKPGVEWPIITNLYGPSECTVDSTSHEVTGENLHCFDFIPIGKPMPNTRIYILNSGKKWLPSGIPGEICVAGLGVGMGYLNQPELTAEKFIFFPNFPLYRTGDLGRWLPDGNIEFSGRIDHQVKIRGYRIELGEIENRLLAHKAVKEAVVILKKDRDGDGDLCAYFTPAFSGRTEGKETHFQELKQFLAEALPDY